MTTRTPVQGSARFAVLLWLLGAISPFGAISPSNAQTPSPLQEWQYSAGVALYRMFEPSQPEWQVNAGLAFESRPLYEGTNTYRELGGPVIDIRFRDEWFASTGEGLGYNFVRGENYRVGVAVGYDFGRYSHDDLVHLKGLGDVTAAPVMKVFGSYVISKEFPLVLRWDVRQFAGGADGQTADVEAYLPLPGSSDRFVMLAGPSVTFASPSHMQTLFGVDGNQALASGYRAYQAHAGASSAGFGFTATRFLGMHWFVHLDLALNRLLGSAAQSPITQETLQNAGVLAVGYRW